MQERFGVVFRNGGVEAAGALEVEDDRLRLRGRTVRGDQELEISFSQLSGVRVARDSGERLNGYATLILERISLPPVQVAPLGIALLPEIAELLASLSQRAEGDVLAVSVPLKPGCLERARRLLEKGPPLDPALLGLRSHDVYLREGEAVFVFRGNNARAHLSQVIQQPAMWRAGLAWQRCLAARPQIIEAGQLDLNDNPAYHWVAAAQQPSA